MAKKAGKTANTPAKTGGQEAAPSAKGLFEATRRKRKADPNQLVLLKTKVKRRAKKNDRHPEDFVPTAEAEAIRALLAYDGDRIRDCGGVWENAVGKGHIAREIKAFGLPVTGSDIVDRGWPGVIVKSFYDFTSSPQRAIITNPPFKEINARHGRGRWLKHLLSLPDWDYLALLLDWNWPAAVINGFAELMDQNPFSYTYLMRWKLDFTDEGSPPQRNAWFVWDRSHIGPREFRMMDRIDYRQATIF